MTVTCATVDQPMPQTLKSKTPDKGCEKNVPQAIKPLRRCVCEKQETLEMQIFKSMTSRTQYRGPGYNKDMVLEDAVAQTPIGAIWDTSHPFAAAMCKPSVSAVAFIVAGFLAANLMIGANKIRANNVRFGSKLRFTALDGLGNVPVRVDSLGFLLDGCAQHSHLLSHSRETSNISITVSYNETFAMNGWWVSLPLLSPKAAPTRFSVEIWHRGPDSGWTQVGSSSVLWTWSGSIVFYDGEFDISKPPQLVRTTVRSQNVVVEFDMRLPWIWTYTKWICNLNLILMTVLIQVVSFLKRQMQARWVCAFFWLVAHVVEILACAGYAYTGETALAIVSGIFSLSDIVYAIAVAYFERYFRHVNGLCGFLFVGAVAAHYTYLQAPQQMFGCYFGLENRGVMEGISLILMSLSAWVFRANSRRSAERVIAVSRALYEKCWADLMVSPGAREAIKEIGEFTDALRSSLPDTIRQRSREPDTINQLRQEPLGALADLPDLNFKSSSSSRSAKLDTPTNLVSQPKTGLHGVLEEKCWPLTLDLDQLFVQAEGLDLFLRLKVQEWALRSRGCFPVHSQDGVLTFRLWEELATDEEALQGVQWAQVKSRERAIEKLYRSYDCDVSRLLDCCRQSIYFEHLPDLLSCLQTIAADSSSRLVRVKNLLSPAYDSRATAGYRSVILNLQIRTEDTRQLGIDTHTCELQLVTVDFARLKVRPVRRRAEQSAGGRGRPPHGGPSLSA